MLIASSAAVAATDVKSQYYSDHANIASVSHGSINISTCKSRDCKCPFQLKPLSTLEPPAHIVRYFPSLIQLRRALSSLSPFSPPCFTGSTFVRPLFTVSLRQISTFINY